MNNPSWDAQSGYWLTVSCSEAGLIPVQNISRLILRLVNRGWSLSATKLNRMWQTMPRTLQKPWSQDSENHCQFPTRSFSSYKPYGHSFTMQSFSSTFLNYVILSLFFPLSFVFGFPIDSTTLHQLDSISPTAISPRENAHNSGPRFMIYSDRWSPNQNKPPPAEQLKVC